MPKLNRTTTAVALLGVLIAAVCLAVPPLHTTTHEFTTAYTLVIACLIFILAARGGRDARQDSNAPGAAWTAHIGRMMALATLAASVTLGIMAVANEVAFGCRFEAGLPYFITTYVPALFFTAVLGSLAGALAGSWLVIIAVALGAIAIDLAHAAGQLYTGPRIYPVDLFLGDLGAFVQREGAAVSAIHAYQRAVLVLFTIALGLIGAASIEARSHRKAFARQLGRYGLGLLLIIALIVVFAGSYVGIGFGEGSLRAEHPNTEQTAHFHVRYSGSEATLMQIDAVIREAEWQWTRITDLWGIEPERRVGLYVFDDEESLERFTGIPYAHAGIGELFLTVDEALRGDPMAHELVHSLHHHLDPTPLVLLNRAMLEGTAMAFEGALTVLPDAHETMAGALKAGKLPPIERVFGPYGFSTYAESSAYMVAGSFLGFLVHEYGMAPFTTLQQTLDFQTAYGKPLDQLESEWHGFLSGIHVRSDRLMTASYYFDLEANPSYLSATCPKVGERRRELEAAAFEAWHRENYTHAAERFRALAEEDNTIEWRRWLARSLFEAGDLDKAVDVLKKAENHPGVKDFEKAALVQDRVELLAEAKAWDRLYAAYADRKALDLGLGPGSIRGEACLRNPRLRAEYAEFLAAERDAVMRQRLHELAQNWPDYEPLQFIYAMTGFAPDDPLDDRAQAALNVATRWPESADALASHLRTLYNEALIEERYDLAEALADALAERCSRPLHRFWGTQARERLAFERA